MKKIHHYKKSLMKGLFAKRCMLILASGLLISIPALAKAGEIPVITDAGTAGKTIKEHMKFPNFTIYKGNKEEVNVVFTVNEAGCVNLVIANTTNAILKKSIEEQFLKLTLKQLKANNAYSIQFNFKTI